jgi:hypothetical protein
MDFIGSSLPISESGFQKALDLLKVGAPELWAVLAVETQGCGFLQDRRPVILFERHIFHKQTKGVYDKTDPAISTPKAGGYIGGTAEYGRLQKAMKLNPKAALNSTSWGIGQIMGLNCRSAGFDSVEAMVTAMVNSEDAQLEGMAGFVRSNNMHVAFAKRDWAAFARAYNGPDFAKNQYDVRLAGNFQKFSAGVLPSLMIRRAQLLLLFLGFAPGIVDGFSGKLTRSAVSAFRKEAGMGDTETIDADLIAALEQRLAQAAAAGQS